MKKLFNDSQLEAMAVPSVTMKQHQLQLKRALLSSGTIKSVPARNHKGWKAIMSKKPLALAGLTLGVAVVALTAGAFIAPKNSVATAAQEAAQQSSAALNKLSPDERGELEQRIQNDPQAQLKEAQAAKDLQLLSYAEASAIMPPPPKAAGPAANNKSEPNLKILKYLKYTNSQGATVILGIDANKIPVISLIMMGEPKGLNSASGSASVGTFGSSSGGTNQSYSESAPAN